MSLRTYRCPFCFKDFKGDHEDGDATDMAPDCGHSFTLGEARRGRPDPANKTEIEQLTLTVRVLAQRVKDLEVTVEHLNLFCERQAANS